MLLTDRYAFDGSARKTRDGYLIIAPRVARTGIQVYSGDEVGKPEMARVRVYRPPEEVFHKDAAASLAGKPVTMDHPPAGVKPENWKDYAIGETDSADIMRDGEFLRIPFTVRDAAAIKAIEDGKRELSVGYECKLEFKDGVTPQGEAYDAVQSSIRANHLAVVTAARGGSSLRIGDDNEGDTDMADQAPKLKTVLVDGLSVETTDAGAQAIAKLEKAVTDAKAETSAEVKKLADAQAEHKKQIDAKDGEIAALKKQIEDGKLTPQKLDAAVTSRVKTIADAKKIAGDDLKTDGVTDADIRKAAVAKKLGDADVAGKSDEYIAACFDTLVKQAGGSSHLPNPLRDALASQQQPSGMSQTADQAWQKNVQAMRDAYKGGDSKAA